MLSLIVEYIFLTTFYGLYFNHQLHRTQIYHFKTTLEGIHVTDKVEDFVEDLVLRIKLHP